MALLPIRAPQPLGLAPSFGFGDRLGLATLGHVDAIRSHSGPILPVFAQQSMRELSRTGRRPVDVMADTTAALENTGYTGIWSADADHITTQEHLNATAGAGFILFTIDPSQHVNPHADTYAPAVLEQKYRDLRDDIGWADEYIGKQYLFAGEPVVFDHLSVKRAAVKFGLAIAHAIKLAAHVDRIVAKRGSQYELELCIDETPQRTTALEHFIIADQCLKSSVKLISIALNYVGGLEPAIDYQGSLDEWKRALQLHRAVAEALGPYKLSLHNGSDKFSLYQILARETRGQFHVKTAGTSYLEALRVAARHHRRLFRRIIDFARQRFEVDRVTYLVSSRLDQVPSAAAICDDTKLEQLYLDQPAGRQILHVTFGSVLTDSALGPTLRDVLVAHPETHREVIATHLKKHLTALERGLP